MLRRQGGKGQVDKVDLEGWEDGDGAKVTIRLSNWYRASKEAMEEVGNSINKNTQTHSPNNLLPSVCMCESARPSK